MERKCLALVSVLVCFILLATVGCQKNAAPVGKTQPQVAPAAKTPQPAPVPGAQPKITFENIEHNFGEVPPGKLFTCEFKFKNTGGSLLKIEDVHASCGCTIPEISKKEYAPGQSGVITVKYHSSNRPVLDTKRVYVQSNDPVNPRFSLTIKAHIVNKVKVEPEKLTLSLREKNAGCPNITLTSTDGNTFSITKIASSNNCIVVDFNSNTRATQYVLQPKVDVEKLRQNFNLEGLLRIELNHPQCPLITVPFNALSEFRVEPSIVTILRAEPNKPISKQVSIRSNYNEPFELDAVTSQLGYTKVVAQRKDPNNGCTLDLLIIPPEPKGGNRIFSDTLIAKIKNGESFKISCRGFYAREPVKPHVADANKTPK